MSPGSTTMMIAAASLLLVTAAAANEPPPLTSATATWTAEGMVELSVTYAGSACEETRDAEVTASDIFGTDVVMIPTAETAEVCTMQIVQNEFSGTIAVEPTTETLSVVVLDPEGQPQAGGSVEIESAGDAAAD